MLSNFFLADGVFDFPPPTYWGSVCSWVLNACELFNYALTKVGMLKERLCFMMSVLTLVFLSGMFTVYPCWVDTPIQYKQV